MNRYASLEAHADAGLGADEPEIHRFTRSCERAELHQESAEAATQQRLDAAAETAWDRFARCQNADPHHPHRDMLRDLAFAAKDRADEFARSQEKSPGSCANSSEASVPTHANEENK